MGQILDGCAKTTHATRSELQRSQASVASLAKRRGIVPCQHQWHRSQRRLARCGRRLVD